MDTLASRRRYFSCLKCHGEPKAPPMQLPLSWQLHPYPRSHSAIGYSPRALAGGSQFGQQRATSGDVYNGKQLGLQYCYPRIWV